ncbi:hypothetical protein FBU59_007221, partial [Linderina macrospora]
MRASEQQQQQQANAPAKPKVVNALPDTKIAAGRSFATAAAANPNSQTGLQLSSRAETASDDQDDTPLALLPPSTSNAPNTSSSADINKSLDGLRISDAPLDAGSSLDSAATQRNPVTLKQVVAFLGTPIKRFVHGYIVLDEFGKEMAATALALHTLELDRAMDRVMRANALGSAFLGDVNQEEYADLLDYYDPQEPAYRRAEAVKESLRTASSVIDLGAARSHHRHHSHDKKPHGVVDPISPTKVRKDRRRGSVSGKSGRRRSISKSNTQANSLLVALEKDVAATVPKPPTD